MLVEAIIWLVITIPLYMFGLYKFLYFYDSESKNKIQRRVDKKTGDIYRKEKASWVLEEHNGADKYKYNAGNKNRKY